MSRGGLAKSDITRRYEREDCVNADAVTESQGARAPVRSSLKRERAWRRSNSWIISCVPLGKDLFLAEKVGTYPQVQRREACVTMRVCTYVRERVVRA